ncbi:hypothetical protein QFC22_001732 [Naganishia vaughanmartiniae]|uniref:Uncharacterized protein n=1 Tax=Naganishia vaughanmartiniae TaxID=1424756 RepID=A0ACC2XG03_9TREE|nr:hypothetical protein QFC22_001732 [Naganishia vaughanmartiniae]
MFARYFTAIALVAAAVLGQQISTPPTLTVCQPTLLSWTGGSQPYFLSVIPGGQASAAALKDFGQQTANSYTWTVDLPAGTQITLKLTDSTGNTVYSSPVTIQAGTSTSCINAAVSGSSSAAAGSSAPAASSVAASSTGGAVVGGASSAVSSAMASASSAAGSATRSSSVAAGASSMASRSSAAAGASSVASAASSGAAAATSAASGANKLVVSGLGAVLLSAVGIVLA